MRSFDFNRQTAVIAGFSRMRSVPDGSKSEQLLERFDQIQPIGDVSSGLLLVQRSDHVATVAEYAGRGDARQRRSASTSSAASVLVVSTGDGLMTMALDGLAGLPGEYGARHAGGSCPGRTDVRKVGRSGLSVQSVTPFSDHCVAVVLQQHQVVRDDWG